MGHFSEEDLKARFGTIWPVHVETLTWFLIECRRHFGGDLDRFLVLCVVGDRSLSRGRTRPDLTYAEFEAGEAGLIMPEPLNARSISDYSGIPRETVRRKVQELMDLGWVERDDSGYLRATTKVRTDLAPLTEASFKYIVTMAKTLSSA